MNDLIKYANVPETVASEEKKFKGYALEDIRYQRALVALRKEFCKSRLINETRNLSRYNPLNPQSKSSTIGKCGAIAGKLLGRLSYLDYAMVGFSIFNTGRKVFSLFKRRK